MKQNHYIERLTQTCNDEQLIKNSKLIKTPKYSIMMSTTKGLNKEENQDCGLITTHPNNPDFIMMLVADGRSISEDGQLAAQMLSKTLERWFLKLPANISPLAFEHTLIKNLRRLNDYLYNEELSETSFVLAIKCKEDTWIGNIGNCRCYTLNDKKISMQTIDDLVWYRYNDKNIIKPDEIKFLAGKDYLEKAIGESANKEQNFYPNIEIIDNEDYDSLILTTHGITDVLNENEIKEIVEGATAKEAALGLVATSMWIDAKPLPQELIERFKKQGQNATFIKKTVPGDSNATALVYKKTKNS